MGNYSTQVESYCGNQDAPDGAATAYQNDAWTCPRPSYMEEWTHRDK
jgi:hypothetical protein